MQRLPNRLVSSLRAAFFLRHGRLLCTITTTSPPARFDAESYLVANCGLTPSQALKASKHLSQLETPDQPDAVPAFLAGLSLSKADVAAAIARSPRFLCCSVEESLAPRVSQLRDIGLSTPQIARLVPAVPYVFVSPAYVSRLAFFLSFFGSFDKLHTTIKRDAQLLCRNVERLIPKMALLRQCGLGVRDIAKVVSLAPRLFAGSQDRLKEVIARAEELGVPRGTPMFRHALVVAYCVGRESATSKMELLKSLGWSSSQVAMAVARMPSILTGSEQRLRRAMNFLTKEAGKEVEAIARGPSLLMYSIERGWRPGSRAQVESHGRSAGMSTAKPSNPAETRQPPQCLQTRLVSPLCSAFSLRRRRLFCTTTTTSPPARFDAESYLVANCGLTPSQALKVSKHLSHLETPDQPDTVRAFLAGLSLSKADVAAATARSPRFLCSSVEESLAPGVSQLRYMGLKTPQIARLVPLVPYVFVSPAYLSRLAFYMSFFGSFAKVHVTIKRDARLLSRSVESAVEPNMAFLRQCGLDVRDIAQVFVLAPRLLAGSQERLKVAIARRGARRAPGHTHVPPRPRRGILCRAGELHRQNGAAQVARLFQQSGGDGGGQDAVHINQFQASAVASHEFPEQGGRHGGGGYRALSVTAQVQHRAEVDAPAQGAEASQREGVAIGRPGLLLRGLYD
ncbi:hypothetical protein BAE44_0001759 [Dichanthelium oligosanthes]|uniref:Transcription termination factor MTEF1, chloroplastic n=1 Tax=Dichanthelium oligosanthes TaxID=888268 RepID=A0A1E5WIJ1_9POAL|nr:hypothetical protein BAE44_0001759 [Dichanthelium oligosanthes]